MLRHGLLAPALSSLVLALAGCGSIQPAPFPAADTRDFSHASGLITTQVTVDDTGGRLIVDTGSPIVLLDPTAFPNAPDLGNVDILVGKKASFSDVQVINEGMLGSPDPSVPIGGLLGCGGVLCQDRASFDYASGALLLGDGSPTAGVGKTTTLPFSFEGGETVSGGGQSIDIPRSRVVVTVTIEGVPRSMIVDTGASALTLRSTEFAEIVKDGRPTLIGPTIETTEGNSSSTIARVATVSVGSVEAEGVIVIGDPATDMFFDTISQEVGHPIDGSLGGSFLGRYFVSIDYPDKKLELAPYDDPTFVVDLGMTVGFSVRHDGGLYVVNAVVPGSEAATRGVMLNDAVKAIDGKELDGLIDSQVFELTAGSPGEPRHVTFGNATSSAIAEKTITFQVFDQLLLQ